MGKLKTRIGDASYEGRIDEYLIVAGSNIEARDLLTKHLGSDPDRKGIRVRTSPEPAEPPVRVIKKL